MNDKTGGTLYIVAFKLRIPQITSTTADFSSDDRRSLLCNVYSLNWAISINQYYSHTLLQGNIFIFLCLICGDMWWQWRRSLELVTWGGNWCQCHPYFSLKKMTTFFLFLCFSLSSLSVSVAPIFPDKLATFSSFFASHSHFYLFHSGVTPGGCHHAPFFYPSDLISPLFFVNSATIFSFLCHPPGGCHPGRSAPECV